MAPRHAHLLLRRLPHRGVNRFDRFAEAVAHAYARSFAFLLAVGLIVAWAALGPPLRFSDQWHLLINTPTTIVTFLGLFLVQNQQWRDGRALNAKLDEVLEQLARVRETNAAQARAAERSEDDVGT